MKSRATRFQYYRRAGDGMFVIVYRGKVQHAVPQFDDMDSFCRGWVGADGSFVITATLDYHKKFMLSMGYDPI